MIRVASERVNQLFGLAVAETPQGSEGFADRYVQLARKVGMRYNVRLLPEYRELYCRGCSTFWVDGRTVRTRLRSGRRVRTCLVCGRVRRVPLRGLSSGPGPDLASPRPAAQEAVGMVDAESSADDEAEDPSEEEA
jgi:ribonuclease P protein subunit RPR2